MKIIINADDLGRSESVNSAISALMAHGMVTSSTLMANGPGFENALGVIKRHGSCSFGIHLNITEFSPLSSSDALAPLLQDGRFESKTVRSATFNSRLKEAVRLEWTAQIDKALSSGVKITHIDSHHHVHTIPALFTTVKRVQERFGIRRIRISRNLYTKADMPSWKLLLKKRLFNLALRHYYRSTSADGFADFRTFIELARSGQLPVMESIELMTHPGHPDYEDETGLLMSGWMQGLEGKFTLGSYTSVCP